MEPTQVETVLEATRERMDKAIEHLRSTFAGVRSGRASPALVEKLDVDYYGTKVPIRQVAGFSVPEPRVLVITPYDKSSLKGIEKAIQQSDLGVNPSSDGAVVRITFPTLTEQRRKDLVKQVRSMTEEGRVAIRNARRQARHDLETAEHAGDLAAGDVERAEKELEKMTHDRIGEVDKLLAHKEKELMEI
jgi:ribosome recycling factor